MRVRRTYRVSRLHISGKGGGGGLGGSLGFVGLRNRREDVGSGHPGRCGRREARNNCPLALAIRTSWSEESELEP